VGYLKRLWSNKAAAGVDPIFKAFCILCWVIWLGIGMLTVIGLLLAHKDAAVIHKGEVLGLFTVTTYFCIGLPVAVKLLLKAVERYGSKTHTNRTD
jgi:hypothetical protein